MLLPIKIQDEDKADYQCHESHQNRPENFPVKIGVLFLFFNGYKIQVVIVRCQKNRFD